MDGYALTMWKRYTRKVKAFFYSWGIFAVLSVLALGLSPLLAPIFVAWVAWKECIPDVVRMYREHSCKAQTDNKLTWRKLLS